MAVDDQILFESDCRIRVGPSRSRNLEWLSMSGSENPKPTHPVDVEYPRSLTRAEKDALIRSMISSMQLEGIEISREVADRALERARRRPVPEILD
jgi:hypothetical protein